MTGTDNGYHSTPDFADWFDVDNIDHVRAYQHLKDTGIWPYNFLPDLVTMTPGWEMTITHRMANRYARNMVMIDDAKLLQQKILDDQV